MDESFHFKNTGVTQLNDLAISNQGYNPEFPVGKGSLLDVLFKHFIHLVRTLSVKRNTGCR